MSDAEHSHHDEHGHGHEPPHVPEKEFLAQTLARIDEALRKATEAEERMLRNLGRGLDTRTRS